MGRIVVIVVLVVLAVWLIRRAFRKAASEGESSPGKAIAGDLVACAHCGLNLPRNEARAAGAELFCSEEHARLGRKDPPAGGR